MWYVVKRFYWCGLQYEMLHRFNDKVDADLTCSNYNDMNDMWDDHDYLVLWYEEFNRLKDYENEIREDFAFGKFMNMYEADKDNC